MKMPRFQMAVKVTTGKGFSNFGKAATGKGFSNFGKGKDPFLERKGSFPFPGKEQFATGKGFSHFGKGKDPFLSQNGQKESFER